MFDKNRYMWYTYSIDIKRQGRGRSTSVIDKLSDAQLINTFENDRVQNVRDVVEEKTLFPVYTRPYRVF